MNDFVPIPLRKPPTLNKNMIEEYTQSRAGFDSESLPVRLDVLIVGCNPTGLALACDLARKGVDFKIVDMAPFSSSQNRSTLLQGQTLHHLYDIGVGELVIDKGHVITGVRLTVNKANTLNIRFSESNTDKYPFIVSIEQSELETVLMTKLESLGHKVYRPAAVSKLILPKEDDEFFCDSLYACSKDNFQSVDPHSTFHLPHSDFQHPAFQQSSFAHSTLEARETQPLRVSESHIVFSESAYPCQANITSIDTNGLPNQRHEKEVFCKYIIGCDGWKSAVRDAVDIKLQKCAPARICWIADVSGTWGFDMDAESINIVQNTNGVLVVIPMTDCRWRVIYSRETNVSPSDSYSFSDSFEFEEFLERINTMVPNTNLQTTWFSTFTMNPSIAETFFKSRAILVGDAAHVFSPVLSQGMNSGIRDAFNLSWKMAAVLNGAHVDVLNSYSTERSAAAHATVSLLSGPGGHYLESGGLVSKFLAKSATILFGGIDAYRRAISHVFIPENVKYDKSMVVGDNYLGRTALQPGSVIPEVQLISLPQQPVFVDRPAHIASATSLQYNIGDGCHTLILALRVLPPGTKVRTLLGCQRNEDAVRWSSLAFDKLNRLVRIFLECLTVGVVDPSSGRSDYDTSKRSQPLRVLWVICGLVDFRSTENTVAINQIKDHVPHKLKLYLTHVSKMPVSTSVLIDHHGDFEKKLSLVLESPGAYSATECRNGSLRSGAFMVVRPDGVVAFNGYAGDSNAVASLVDYGINVLRIADE